MNTIQAAVAGGERVFEIMDEVPEIKNKKMHSLYKIYKAMLHSRMFHLDMRKIKRF